MLYRAQFGVGFLLAISACLTGCSGGGGGGADEGAGGGKAGDGLARQAGTVQSDVPFTLNGKQCYPLVLNNSSQVLFGCPSASGFDCAEFAVWEGGDSLKSAYDPTAGRQKTAGEQEIYCDVASFTDDGTIIGNLHEYNGEEVVNSTGFSVKNGELREFEIGNFSRVYASDNGSYITITETSNEGSVTLLQSFEPVALSDLPDGIGFYDAVPNNSGAMYGTADITDTERGFVAFYGGVRTADSFQLLPVVGRPEFAFTFRVTPNNQGSSLLEYYADPSTVSVQDVGLVARAAYITPDGSITKLDPGGTDTTQVQPEGFNDSSVVFGLYYDIAGDFPAFPFLFSPRRGIVDAREIISQLSNTSVILAAINDLNQVLTVEYGAEGTDIAQIQILEIPADF